MSERATRIAALRKLLEQRIVVLDGAMGTMIQRHKLDEGAYRGERFRTWPRDVKGNNDLLTLTQPADHRGHSPRIPRSGCGHHRDEHLQFERRLSQADYGMEELVAEINYEAARIARGARRTSVAGESGVPRFVAGALGPTNRTASLSPDVNDPGMPQHHVR